MIDIKTIRPGFDVGPMALRTSELGNGCGAFTTRPIEDGEVVFALPLSAIITSAGFLARERLSDYSKGARELYVSRSHSHW